MMSSGVAWDDFKISHSRQKEVEVGQSLTEKL
jgi:hypothetical protein